MAKAGKSKLPKKLPKRIAGVKIPKAMRKSGAAVASFLGSDTGRVILAGLLTEAAQALVRNRPSAAGVAEAGTAVADKGVQAATTVKDVASDVAKDVAQAAAVVVSGVVSEAAKRILPASLTGADQAGRAEGAQAAVSRSKKGARDKPSQH